MATTTINTTNKLNTLANLRVEKTEDNFYIADLLGLTLIIDSTGYFNATKLCSSGGKNFTNWMQLDTSKKLIDFISDKIPYGLIVMLNADINNETATSGVYVCNELLLSIASWAHPEKYIKFNKIIIAAAERQALEIEDKYISKYSIINDKLDRLLFQLEPTKTYRS